MITALRRDAAGEPEGLLVLFHGRGADEHDLYPLLDALDPERRLLGVTPRGPLSLPPGGAHWYVVPRVGYPDPATFSATYEEVSAWLDTLAEETGIAPSRAVLGGFSQGAVMSLALGLGRGRPHPAAIVAFSGFVPVVPGWEPEYGLGDRINPVPEAVSTLPPVAIGHGTYDPIIPVELGRQAKTLLEEAGADVLWRESPMPHTIDPEFVAEVVPWLRRALSASAAHR